MKRKLSLLMAAIMALSTLPFTATEVQANTTNRIHGIPGTTVPADTGFVENQQTGRAWNSNNLSWNTFGTVGALPDNVGGGQALGYAIHAGYLELELRSRQRAGDMFRFELDNGEWLFRSSNTAAEDLRRVWEWYDTTGSTAGPGGTAGPIPSPGAIINGTTGLAGAPVDPITWDDGLQTTPGGNVPQASGTTTNLTPRDLELIPRPAHGSAQPGVNSIQDLILLNREQAVRDRRGPGATGTGTGYNASGYIVTFDGPLGNVSSANRDVTGIFDFPADQMLPNGMPPIVRPQDWNFPHGFPNNYIPTTDPASPPPWGQRRIDPPSAVAGRITEVLSMPFSALDTTPLGATTHRIGSGISTAGVESGQQRTIGRTYDIRRGFFLVGTAGNEGSYVRFANAVQDTFGGAVPAAGNRWTADGSTNNWSAASNGPTRSAKDSRQNIEVPYIMDISRIADGRTEATVTLLDDADPQDIVIVPLIIRVPTSEGATIRLLPAGHLPFVTQGTWHIAAAAGQSTSASIVNPVTARDKFEIEALIIRENRANSIRRTGGSTGLANTNERNAFDLVLSPGFYFDPSVLTNLVVFLERDLTWRAIPGTVGREQAVPGAGEINVDYRVWFPEGHETSRDRLRIQLDRFNQSQLIEGSMALYGLVIWAEETVPFDTDLEIRLQNTTIVSPGSFWTQNQNPGQMLPAPPPAGWTMVNVAVDGAADRDYIRLRADGTYDLIRVNEDDMSDAQMTVVLNRGFRARGALVGFMSVASRNNVAFLNATSLGAIDTIVPVVGTNTPQSFRVRDFTVVNPGFGSTVNEINEANMIAPNDQVVRAGTRRDWGIVLRTEGDVPELISGRYEGPTSMPGVEHQTARTVFEEVVPNSWWAGRQVILSLPEDVKWRRVWFQETRYPPGSPAGNETIAPNTIQRQHYYVNIEVPPTGQALLQPQSGTGATAIMHPVGGRATTARHGVHFDENRMYWTDVLAWRGPQTGPGNTINTQNRGAYIRFDSWVSIAADFEGDIILTASGSAVPGEQNVPMPSAIIATALPPVRVSVEELTDLRVGFQHQPAFDIVITESRAGALMRDRNIRLSVTDLIATDIMFGPSVNVEVTNSSESGFTIRNVSTGLAGSLYGGGGSNIPTMGIEANRGTISFDVASISHRVPAVITVSNVSVRVDRTVPETNDVPYWVVVWGNAIANNFGQFDTRPVGSGGIDWPMWERTNLDRFLNNPGIFTDYLRVVTGGDGSPWLTQEIRVTVGEDFYTVNGVPYDMDVAAFIDPASDSVFVPLRFIANALGLRDGQDIEWDNHLRRATLTLPDGRVVSFQADSTIMLDNGIERSITNAVGEAITPVIVTIDQNDGGRMFLPFRYFGETVLRVPVSWEQATQTAVFNPSGSLGVGSGN